MLSLSLNCYVLLMQSSALAAIPRFAVFLLSRRVRLDDCSWQLWRVTMFTHSHTLTHTFSHFRLCLITFLGLAASDWLQNRLNRRQDVHKCVSQHDSPALTTDPRRSLALLCSAFAVIIDRLHGLLSRSDLKRSKPDPVAIRRLPQHRIHALKNGRTSHDG